MVTLSDELKNIDLGDKRLNRRTRRLLEKLGRNPSASIPAACGAWKEVKAAYRLLDNEKVDGQKILEPHYGCTGERMQRESVILCIQDTTELDYTGKNDIKGLGPLNYETRKGLYLHPTLAVTPDRICLGILDAWEYTREPGSLGKGKTASRSIEEKESLRWLEGYQRVCDRQKEMPGTQLIYVADREGDMYDIFFERESLLQQGVLAADWLIRFRADRNTVDGQKLTEVVEKATVIGHVEFDLPADKGRKKRRVTQSLRVVRVEINPPKRTGKKFSAVEITALLASEDNPPAGEEPLEWLLLSSVVVETAEQAEQMLQWYLARWQVEIFFRILKSGCKVEELQLESEERIEAALSLYMIIAWRILFLVMLGRECPELPCNVVFDDDEWKAACIVSRKKIVQEQPPTLNEMIRIIAGFGGFIGRKGDGFPGPQTLWIGLQRVQDFALAIQSQKEMGMES
jgi:IS4 transposase